MGQIKMGDNKHKSLCVAVGRRIKAARESAELTQQQLSEKCGLAVTHISNYERGSRLPSVPNLLLICRTLSTSSDKILGIRQAS